MHAAVQIYTPVNLLSISIVYILVLYTAPVHPINCTCTPYCTRTGSVSHDRLQFGVQCSGLPVLEQYTVHVPTCTCTVLVLNCALHGPRWVTSTVARQGDNLGESLQYKYNIYCTSTRIPVLYVPYLYPSTRTGIYQVAYQYSVRRIPVQVVSPTSTCLHV